MKLTKFFIYFIFWGSFGRLAAYITNVIRLEKYGQKIICCGDVHDFQQPYANIDQLGFLRKKLKSLDPNNTCVFVEDVKAYNGTDPLVAEYFKQWPIMMPEDGLVDLARRRNPGLETVNLEWRYLSFAALLPFLQHNGDTHISARDVVEEFDTKVALVKSYNDGEQLSQFYREQLAEINDKNMEKLHEIRQFSGTLTQWIRKNVALEKQVLFAHRLRLFDVRLSDFIAIHEIVQRSHVAKILIFAGGLHVYNIGIPLVKYLGFKKISSIGTDIPMPYSESSLSFDSLRPYAPPERLVSRFKPLPAEELKVLFE